MFSELCLCNRMHNFRQAKLYTQDRQGTLMLVSSRPAAAIDMTTLPIVVEHSRWELTGGAHQPCLIPTTFQKFRDCNLAILYEKLLKDENKNLKEMA